MGKVIRGLVVSVGIWVGIEVMNEGSNRALDGLFSGLVSDSESVVAHRRSAARSAGDAAEHTRDEASAWRKRMRGE